MNKSMQTGLTLTFVELAGDISLKKYAQSGGNQFLLGGCVAYAGLIYTLTDALKTEKLAIVNGYWDGLSNVVTTIAGISLDEEITPVQLTGLVLISVGLFML